MKTLAILLTLAFSVTAYSQVLPDTNYGWLTPGHSWFEFNHRIVSPTSTPAIVDRFYRGKFIFGWYKPIFTKPSWQISLLMVPQFLYGGFNERRILLPAFNFRGELSFLFHWSDHIDLVLSNLHYSTHIMDKLPISTLEDAVQLKDANLSIGDFNILRIGATWRTGNLGIVDQIYGNTGIQPIRMNYWLFTEISRAFRGSSYETYDRRGYTEVVGFTTFGQSRLLAKFMGEVWKTARWSIELRYSTKITPDPTLDGLQIYLLYEGGNIQTNEVAITPHNGISRNWLLAGLRFIN